MTCVVKYLESIHWESSGISLDLAEGKLTRIVAELERLCSSKEKRAAGSSLSKAKKTHLPEPQIDEAPGDTPAQAEWNRAMDIVFECAVGGKNAENAYKPRRRNQDLSEEEEDDFDLVELDKPSTPEGSRKRKVLVVEDETSTAVEQLAAAAARPKKKSKKAAAPVSAPPKVTVIELDDESGDESDAPKKRGPKNSSREHYHAPIAVKRDGELRWEFKCKHCNSYVP
ncbi:hypothetical protein B0H10DRAFT_2440103 [Mycena sp. CBHHK59/15]|nr:hypothetical protein B0H10DRAFT_2440103 [Mycena sp. CBHHK59/15]